MKQTLFNISVELSKYAVRWEDDEAIGGINLVALYLPRNTLFKTLSELTFLIKRLHHKAMYSKIR